MKNIKHGSTWHARWADPRYGEPLIWTVQGVRNGNVCITSPGSRSPWHLIPEATFLHDYREVDERTNDELQGN